jgi:RNA polymerase sigma factor (sigma-70 family)
MDDAATPVPPIPAGPGEATVPAQDLADIWIVEYGLVYQAEKPGLIRYLLHCEVDYPTAEDLAQVALEELYRKWGTVDKPRPWLRKVATRKIGRSRVSGECSLEGHDQPSTMPDPAATIESLWEEDAVLSAIQQLPLKEKQVFALHFDRFETGEIAEILQMTPAAVRQNLARARARLKKLPRFEGGI